MFNATHRGVESYLRTRVESSTPEELIVMLFDGALRFTREARDAAERRDVPARAAAVSRALAIIAELQGSLDFDRGGPIAASLEELYAFVSRRLIDGSVGQKTEAFDDVLRVLTPLRDGWTTLASHPTTLASGQ